MDNLKYNWTVFISQTGSEIYALSKYLKAVPKLIITNNPKKLHEEVANYFKNQGVEIKVIPFRPCVDHYLSEDILESKLITLHGYLRILPVEFFKNVKTDQIYNGHPGLITKYPELKNKDPQIRAWEGDYEYIGSVIHKVVQGVDEGEIVRSSGFLKRYVDSLDSTYKVLASTSLQLWSDFLTELLRNYKEI